jgi:hypothetical protein
MRVLPKRTITGNSMSISRSMVPVFCAASGSPESQGNEGVMF